MTVAVIPKVLSEDEALSLLDSITKKSQAEEVFLSLKAEESALSRFSENQISQNVSKNTLKLTITSYFGKRKASVSLTELEPDAIAHALKTSEELAQLAPEDPEWVPLLDAQTYEARKPAFSQETAQMSPLAKGEIIQQVCTIAKEAGVNGSGTLSSDVALLAIANSQGVRAACQTTEADFSFTARVNNGSSWNNRTAWHIGHIPYQTITQGVIERAIASCNPKAIEPDIYPVVFEAAAFADLLPWIIWYMDARSADEGRSFMSKRDDSGNPQGNLMGEQLFNPLVQVQRDPGHELLQSPSFFEDGFPNNHLEIIKNGIPQVLSYSRYWAQKQHKTPTGSLYPIVMTGGDQTTQDLIAQTERGILVSRTWYINSVNPKTLEVTGMTRDGTFWIEDGQIAYPIKNMRFNQSLPEMLLKVEGLSGKERFGSSVIPGIKVSGFRFSSITDSV